MFSVKWFLHNVKCNICSQVEGKDKLFGLKWDALCKHIGRKKTNKNIGLVKKGEWYYMKSCKHVKNHVELASCNCQIITK